MTISDLIDQLTKTEGEGRRFGGQAQHRGMVRWAIRAIGFMKLAIRFFNSKEIQANEREFGQFC